MALGKPPSTLSKIGRTCKIAQDFEQSDGVICFYSRFRAVELALKMDHKTPEDNKFIESLMIYLEKAKQDNKNDERYTDEIAGIAHVQNYALKLFAYAFKRDEEGHFESDTVSAFISAATLLDVLDIRPVSDEIVNARKYAKYKALYITNCLKTGKTPVAGPLGEGEAGFAPAIISASIPSKPTVGEDKKSPVVSPKHPPAAVNAVSTEERKEDKLDPELCKKVTKSAKFGIDCLSYSDRAGAIKFFQEAIDTLKLK